MISSGPDGPTQGSFYTPLSAGMAGEREGERERGRGKERKREDRDEEREDRKGEGEVEVKEVKRERGREKERETELSYLHDVLSFSCLHLFDLIQLVMHL